MTFALISLAGDASKLDKNDVDSLASAVLRRVGEECCFDDVAVSVVFVINRLDEEKCELVVTLSTLLIIF